MYMLSRNSQGVRNVLLWAAAQTALVMGHFAYAAHRYDDPLRLHVIAPAGGMLLVAGVLAALYLRHPGRITLSLLAAEVGVAFVGLFGGYHGAFNHAAKDVLYLAGVGPERLARIFDSPDFALPTDLVFEVTGLATLVVGIIVAVQLVRLVRGALATS